MKLCECGCGEIAPTAKQTTRKLGYIKGQPMKFIHGHNGRTVPPEKHSGWKGGRRSHSLGYVWVYDHAQSKSVLEHIAIATRILGRPLPDGVQVHHVNDNGADNRNGNLIICEDQAYHKLLHRRRRALLATGSVNALKCQFCQQWGTVDNIYVPPSGKGSQFHRACANNYHRARKGLEVSQ